MFQWLTPWRFSQALREEEWRGPQLEPFRQSVAIHPARAPRILAMLPGYDGTLDGYADKYVTLARYAAQELGVAVVRSENAVLPGRAFEDTCVQKAQNLLAGIDARARAICAHRRPELWLFGYSAGASAAAAVAASHPGLTRLLLVAPSADAGYDRVVGGLREFPGEVRILAAGEDEVVGDLPRDLARAIPRCRLHVVPHCDHQFRGERNGRLLSHALRWAFLDDPSFPDPARGVALYD